MTVEADLFSRVTTSSGFSNLAGTRCYFIEAPQDVAKPYCTFFRVSSQTNSFMGVDDDLLPARFQFDCYGATPNSARALLEEVRKALRRYRGTGTVTIDDILMQNDQDHGKEEDTKLFHSSIDAIVYYRL